MPFGIGKKRSKPQVQQQTQSAPAPAAAAPAPGPSPVPADWAAVLKPSGPKGRFTQGQNAKVGYTQ